MGKISVNVGPLQGNVSSARNAASGLGGVHLHSLNLGDTNARPFVQIAHLEQELNGIISKYAGLAGRDAGQFGNVSTGIQAADQDSARYIGKN